MQYVSIFDNVTKKRLCFLENAYNVGYTLNLNKLHEATFALPSDDPKNRYCQVYRYVEIWDSTIQANNGRVGLFRILPTQQTKNATTRELVYTCEHVLATLIDDVLLGWHEIGNLGVYTQNVIDYVLNQQRTKRWQLSACEFSHQFLYGWENENLLSALFSVPNCFAEQYTWEYDTSDINVWNLYLRQVNETPVAEIRYKKNIIGITKTVDPSEMATRLIPLGYGEGVNQLNIADLNNGSMVLVSPNVATYGEITRIWIDRRYQYADSLMSAAVSMLNELDHPYISYDIDLSCFENLAQAKVGEYIRVIDDEDGIDFNARITQIEKNDVYGNPTQARMILANRSKDIATTIADLADRQRVNETYSQGAVTVYTMSFTDNADANHPAEIRFPIPDSVVHINSIMLDGRIENARGYSNAVSTTETTATATSYEGSQYRTSTAVTLLPANTEAIDDGGIGAANHNHGIYLGAKIALSDGAGGLAGYVSWTPSGAHEHEAHDHEIRIPGHDHTVEIPALSINSEFGIYESGRADYVTIKVDNTTITDSNHPNGQYTDISDLNITTAFTGANNGTITRGWHTLTITPNQLTRINVSLAVQLFANSRGGGQY